MSSYYQSIKKSVSKAIAEQEIEYKKAVDYMQKEERPIVFNSFMTGLSGIYNMQLARYRGRISVLDEILGGLIGEILNKNITLETLKRDAIIKDVEDTIEASKQIPTLIKPNGMMYR